MSGELNCKPNSKRYKKSEQGASDSKQKRVEKVVTGKVKTRKKSEIRKFKDVFISEDAGNVKEYVFMDVLIPAMKKAISDIIKDGVDMILYGETRKRSSSSGASYVSYRSYSDRFDPDGNTRRRSRSAYDYADIVLETRAEAEEILDCMSELIDTYDSVSVADLYDLVGISGNYTDNKYGWTNLRNAGVVHVRDGYLLQMPKAHPLD